ncbi:radical SAM protein [Fusibacter paucivorans]|uniref:Radical SAM protein n=1 Tax=Fusibacter paucivorans TaxID=76009 RepID=A0ABS5PU88_9FIRM|nr:radical SAM protein [Fusibacter paucivorans]MBS7528656.1 radical SAM protein [Fusibacter paucivorans]
MTHKTIKEHVESFAGKKVLDYLGEDPDKNLPKLMDWVDRFDTNDLFASQRKQFRNILDEPDGNWYQLIKSLWTDIDEDVRKTFFNNFIVNTALIGCDRQEKAKEKYQCNIPWAILMDPTSACNLSCIGCWAAEYGDKLNMSYETLDSIIKQGKKLGTYMYIYSGGEPLVRKKDIIKLCEAHPDCEFLSFTNATLIDEAFADEMLRVKNFVPAISIEGFEEETDFRRGKGTYQKIVQAMAILKKKKLPFGISCCYTKKNAEIIGSEEYIDDMIEKGAKFAWFFTYMPVGIDAVPELMASPAQREFMYHQLRKFRKTKKIFTMDFWNDGEYVEGCIAGGRRYLHINANGDIEPCAFIHYADANIYDKTLLEAYQSPLFMQYRQHQPFNENHLRPCPLLDNPGALTQIVACSKAKSTDFQNPEDVVKLSSKCKKAAMNWAPVAENLWENAHPPK